MRIDVFLKRTGLIKHRTDAKQACEHGAVTISGRTVKPGRKVEEGQRIRIAYPRRILEVEVVAIPQGSVKKAERESCYRVVETREREWDDG